MKPSALIHASTAFHELLPQTQRSLREAGKRLDDLAGAFQRRVQNASPRAIEERDVIFQRIQDTKFAMMDELTVVRADGLGDNIPHMDLASARQYVDDMVIKAFHRAASEPLNHPVIHQGWADKLASEVPEAWHSQSATR